MALKDWEIQKNTRFQIVYFNSYDNKKIVINYIQNSLRPSKNANWEVYYSNLLNVDLFNSKAKAIKHAKQYMRKH